MTFLREIWDKKAAKREVEVTTRKEYEEKVSRKGSCRKGDKINIVIDADHPDTVIEFSKRSKAIFLSVLLGIMAVFAIVFLIEVFRHKK